MSLICYLLNSVSICCLLVVYTKANVIVQYERGLVFNDSTNKYEENSISLHSIFFKDKKYDSRKHFKIYSLLPSMFSKNSKPKDFYTQTDSKPLNSPISLKELRSKEEQTHRNYTTQPKFIPNLSEKNVVFKPLDDSSNVASLSKRESISGLRSGELSMNRNDSSSVFSGGNDKTRSKSVEEPLKVFGFVNSYQITRTVIRSNPAKTLRRFRSRRSQPPLHEHFGAEEKTENSNKPSIYQSPTKIDMKIPKNKSAAMRSRYVNKKYSELIRSKLNKLNYLSDHLQISNIHFRSRVLEYPKMSQIRKPPGATMKEILKNYETIDHSLGTPSNDFNWYENYDIYDFGVSQNSPEPGFSDAYAIFYPEPETNTYKMSERIFDLSSASTIIEFIKETETVMTEYNYDYYDCTCKTEKDEERNSEMIAEEDYVIMKPKHEPDATSRVITAPTYSENSQSQYDSFGTGNHYSQEKRQFYYPMTGRTTNILKGKRFNRFHLDNNVGFFKNEIEKQNGSHCHKLSFGALAISISSMMLNSWLAPLF